MLACSWKKSTGLDCPACGFQRSFDELVHGHFVESLQLFPALLPFIFLVIYSGLHLWNPKKFPARIIVVNVCVVGALMIGNWVYKMF
ncbi:hypothetical protein D3C87_309930 [compost metagenome]